MYLSSHHPIRALMRSISTAGVDHCYSWVAAHDHTHTCHIYTTPESPPSTSGLHPSGTLTPPILSSNDGVKKSTQATTTLHALVNLKTSSLRLFPLSVSAEDAIDASSPDSPGPSSSPAPILPHDAPHCIEFQYDCDAPRVRISLDVYSRKRPDGKSNKTTVYSGEFEGGFGKALRVEDGATLELSLILASLQREGVMMRQKEAAEKEKKEKEKKEKETEKQKAANATTGGDGPDEAAGDSPAGENQAGANNAASDSELETSPGAVGTSAGATGHDATAASRRRLSAFAFNKKRHQRSDVSGPALRVVDVDAVTEPSAAGTNGGTGAVTGKKDEKEKDDVNVRVSIMLEALDERGRSLRSANIQTTRLVIVRAGNAATATSADSRHWTVQVVRRDATIGAHTFRLHDIYGLSSSKSAAAAPTASESTSSPVTTYPPTAAAVDAANDAANEMSSECVLCLSSPREVVLLPCRHLVACKDCALNMVEYGAGGQLVQPTEETVAPAPATGAGGDVDLEAGLAAGGAGAAGGGSGSGDATPNPAVVAAATFPAAAPPPRPHRRRRRAKGWQCPVCRQRESF
ncbi:hypothetical protein DL93DRAFT_1836967 [Clavulina sp. PMI_390]|nr:hypothetical protein DL93DRAFT_1836967 [Clavulina sp. PMI_390]